MNVVTGSLEQTARQGLQRNAINPMKTLGRIQFNLKRKKIIAMKENITLSIKKVFREPHYLITCLLYTSRCV